MATERAGDPGERTEKKAPGGSDHLLPPVQEPFEHAGIEGDPSEIEVAATAPDWKPGGEIVYSDNEAGQRTFVSRLDGTPTRVLDLDDAGHVAAMTKWHNTALDHYREIGAPHTAYGALLDDAVAMGFLRYESAHNPQTGKKDSVTLRGATKGENSADEWRRKAQAAYTEAILNEGRGWPGMSDQQREMVQAARQRIRAEHRVEAASKRVEQSPSLVDDKSGTPKIEAAQEPNPLKWRGAKVAAEQMHGAKYGEEGAEAIRPSRSGKSKKMSPEMQAHQESMAPQRLYDAMHGDDDSSMIEKPFKPGPLRAMVEASVNERMAAARTANVERYSTPDSRPDASAQPNVAEALSEPTVELPVVQPSRLSAEVDIATRLAREEAASNREQAVAVARDEISARAEWNRLAHEYGVNQGSRDRGHAEALQMDRVTAGRNQVAEHYRGLIEREPDKLHKQLLTEARDKEMAAEEGRQRDYAKREVEAQADIVRSATIMAESARAKAAAREPWFDTITASVEHEGKQTRFENIEEEAMARREQLGLEPVPFLEEKRGGLLALGKWGIPDITKRGPKVVESYFRTPESDNIVVLERRNRRSGELLSQTVITTFEPLRTRGTGEDAAVLPSPEIRDMVKAIANVDSKNIAAEQEQGSRSFVGGDYVSGTGSEALDGEHGVYAERYGATPDQLRDLKYHNRRRGGFLYWLTGGRV